MEYTETMVPSMGGLNYDDDERLIKNTDGRVRENVMVETNGRFGALVPIRGTAQLPNSKLPADVRMIGSCADNEKGSVIFFYTNETFNYIIEVKDTITHIAYKEELGWKFSDVVSAGVMDEKLFFSVGGGTFKLNIERAKTLAALKIQSAVIKHFNGSADVTVNKGQYVYVEGWGMYLSTSANAQGISVLSGFNSDGFSFVGESYYNLKEVLPLIKQPPTSTVVATPAKDMAADVLTDRAMRFSYAYIYKDKEVSRYASVSKLIVNPSSGDDKNPSEYNAVDVVLTRGNEDVSAVRVVVEDVITNTWYRLEDVPAKKFKGRKEYTFRYKAGLRQEVVVGIDVGSDAVSVSAQTIALINGQVVLSNLVEGYDVPEVDMSVAVKETEFNEISITVTPLYAQETSNISSPNPVRYRTNRVVLSIPPNEAVEGAIFNLDVNRNGTITRFGSVVSNGEKGYEFRDRIMALYNTVTNASDSASGAIGGGGTAQGVEGSDKFTSPFNVRAIYKEQTYSTVSFNLVYGFAAFIQTAADGIFKDSEFAGFDGGNITKGRWAKNGIDFYYLRPSGTNVALPMLGLSQSVEYSLQKASTYKTFSTYDVAVKYFDKYKRSAPSVNKHSVSINNNHGLVKTLNVTLKSKPPEWAEYYSLCTSQSNMTDSTTIRMTGGGSVYGVDGDDGNAIMELELNGIARAGEDGNPLYWAIVQQRYYTHTTLIGQKQYRLTWVVLFSREKYVDQDHENMEARVAHFDLRFDKESVIVDSIPCWRMELTNNNFRFSNCNARGYIIIRKSAVAPLVGGGLNGSEARVAFPVYNDKKEVDGKFEYKFDIAPYLNMIKKKVDYEKRVFVPKEGDFVRFLQKDTSGRFNSVLESKVAKIDLGKVNDDGYFDKVYVTTELVEESVDLEDETKVEFFRSSNEQASLLFEEPILRKVLTIGNVRWHDGWVLSTSSTTKEVLVSLDNGDGYIRKRYDVNPNGERYGEDYIIEDFRYSDTEDSRLWSRGRVHTTNTEAGQRKLTTAMRHGGRLMDGTLINNSCRFDGLDVAYLDETDGPINAVIPMSSNMLKVLQSRRSVSQDVGVTLVSKPDGSQEYVVSDRFFRSSRKSLNQWGTSNPEGVILVGGNVLYYDINTGQMIRDGQNGQFPISGKVSFGDYSHDYKMHTYFKQQAEYWRGKGLRVTMGYDEGNGVVWVSMRAMFASTIPFNPNLPPTVMFHEGSNRWVSTTASLPDGYAWNGIRMYSTLKGVVWEHNTNKRNTIYGVHRPSKIGLVFNSQPNMMKLLDSVGLKMSGVNLDNLPTEFIKIRILPSPSYPTGMETTITKEMLRLEENTYRSEVGRNENTPGLNRIEAFFDGEEMRGFSGVIELDFGTSDFVFMLGELNLSVSK